MKRLIDNLYKGEGAELSALTALLSGFDDEIRSYAAKKAVDARSETYGNKVYLRGLIEIGNVCKNDCFYCGIRKSNKNVSRYSLSADEILSACEKGYKLGFSTFVLQGGEVDNDEEMVKTVGRIKALYPACAVTLSLGEKSRDTYKRYKDAGADRYLLRHETCNKEHYGKIHPDSLSYDNRIRCLYDLKDLGFQVGCGFMVGSPYQTDEHLASELLFIKEFKPHMVGIGPFLPHKDTPFNSFGAGSVEKTLMMLSLIRIMNKNVLLPATTALATALGDGRIEGIRAGANVVMPNLSPSSVRDKYTLYDNKVHSGAESAEGLEMLRKCVKEAGCTIDMGRGDSLVKGE
ncbi:MAG: [Clostridia bacterium]|nr:[FeFe] hydrogenase H-cluster radical SAM maturase HydE [Clostridia bacterium]